MAVANEFRIPQYISAPTKDRLVRILLLNNLEHGIEFDYTIMRDGEGYTAWFYKTIDKMDLLRKSSEAKKLKDVEEKSG